MEVHTDLHFPKGSCMYHVLYRQPEVIRRLLNVQILAMSDIFMHVRTSPSRRRQPSHTKLCLPWSIQT